MKAKGLKRVIVMMLTLTMLVTGTGMVSFAESLTENTAEETAATEQVSETIEEGMPAEDTETAPEDGDAVQKLTAADWEAALPDEISTDAREAMGEIAESQSGSDIALYKAFAR